MMRLTRLLSAALCAMAVLAAAIPCPAQRKGDYLTADELDTVRDVQQIDKRAEVFLKVADRRLEVLANPAAEPKGRLSEHMGTMQTGTPAELLDDYRRAIEELMTKLDDEFERKAMSASLRRALELVVKETDRQLQQLDALKPRLSSGGAAQFLLKAVAANRELYDGAKGALLPEAK